jgi:hypothetical protein
VSHAVTCERSAHAHPCCTINARGFRYSVKKLSMWGSTVITWQLIGEILINSPSCTFAIYGHSVIRPCNGVLGSISVYTTGCALESQAWVWVNTESRDLVVSRTKDTTPLPAGTYVAPSPRMPPIGTCAVHLPRLSALIMTVSISSFSTRCFDARLSSVQCSTLVYLVCVTFTAQRSANTQTRVYNRMLR